MTAVDVLARTLPSMGLIVGALLILRHWAQRGQRGPATAGVRVVSRTGLAKGAVVAVVAVGERRLLVGASEHGISLLTELEKDLEPAPVPAPAASPSPASTLPATLAATVRSSSTDRPRMAPIDRLRALTVRQAVSSHPRRPTGVHRRT